MRGTLHGGVKVYVQDPKLMSKSGEAIKSCQEQAKHYFNGIKSIMDIVQHVDIKNGQVSGRICREAGIDDAKLDRLLLSVSFIGDGAYAVTVYYTHKNGHPAHKTISNVSGHHGDYVLADKILCSLYGSIFGYHMPPAAGMTSQSEFAAIDDSGDLPF